ncbi:MAG: hypothetical protein AAF235_05030 [Planctomycetota bacterium]
MSAREQLRAQTAAWREEMRAKREAQRQAAAEARRAYVEQLRRDTASASTNEMATVEDASTPGPSVSAEPDSAPDATQPVASGADASHTEAIRASDPFAWSDFAMDGFVTDIASPANQAPPQDAVDPAVSDRSQPSGAAEANDTAAPVRFRRTDV